MLKRVSIQNFKSLKDVTLDLQKVNLLIGPNNSGKTNFLKALDYFGQDDSIHSHEPDRNKIAYKKNSGLISVQFKFDPKNEDYDFRKYDYWVFECEINPNGNVIKSNWYQDLANPHIKTHKVSDKQLFDFNAFTERVNALTIYKPDPNQFIKPADFSADEIKLNGDCSNLIPFLFYLNTNYKRAYQQIEKDLAKCVIDIVSFSSPPVKVGKESKLGLKFFGKNDEDYWAEDVSEGVLYFLALLTIINQPNPPKLLLLEEPEKGIHPRRIEEVINFIFGLADDKDVQVIMTTHSPAVVDMFKDMPESVFIFDKDDEGATHVKNLQKDIIEPETAESEKAGFDPPRYLNGLGEAWKVGFLGGVPR